MQIIRRLEELAPALAAYRRAGEKIAAVPTMGALHAGHMALVAEGQRRADRVVATIFVNPMQFGAGEDLDRYPRQESADAEMLEAAGCDLLWLPAVDDIYPTGFATKIHVTGLSERWEGESRPGHFDGVATVVAKLILIILPDLLLFGEKDFQQLAVIRRMALDLSLGIEIVGVSTVRDADGLALSSRNAYLSPDDRQRAVALPDVLETARDAIVAGKPIAATLTSARESLHAAGFSKIDYFALVDAALLEPVENTQGSTRLIAAATIGGTRLIDNIAVEMEASPG
jgi:pantoate--beta-alanine ligase